jgi:hypothetical protein
VSVSYPGLAGTPWDLPADAETVGGDDPWALALYRRMPSYYSGGIVMAPWAVGLLQAWHEHVERILKGFAGDPLTDDVKRIRHADQFGLTTAITALRQTGIGVRPLPLAYHARPPLLLSGALTWDEVACYHYTKAFLRCGESLEEVARFLYGRRLHRIRRRLAGPLGLRAIRSPMFRMVPPDRLRAFGRFFEVVHGIVQAFDL